MRKLMLYSLIVLWLIITSQPAKAMESEYSSTEDVALLMSTKN